MSQIKIRGNKQIMDLSIENGQIANGTIELGKLANGADILLRDGSVAMNADFDAGTHKIINVADATNDTDAVNLRTAEGNYLRKDDNLYSLTDKAAARTNLDVYSKAEVDSKITGSLNYRGIIDLTNGDVKISTLGASLSKGDFYKIKGDGNVTNEDASTTLAVNNGDMLIVNQDVADTTDVAVDVAVIFDKVDNTESADILRTSNISTNTDFTVDGTSLADRQTIKAFVDNSISNSTPNVVYGEEPTVTDGSTDVTLSHTPTLIRGVYVNGLREKYFSNTGATISFQNPLMTGDVVAVDYEY